MWMTRARDSLTSLFRLHCDTCAMLWDTEDVAVTTQSLYLSSLLQTIPYVNVIILDQIRLPVLSPIEPRLQARAMSKNFPMSCCWLASVVGEAVNDMTP